MIIRIISGGQTGVDRAALDVAIKLNIPHGGWCPKGRLAENGIIPSKYSLIETESKDYSIRTKLNIKDSDGTLILVSKLPIHVKDGTLLTIQEAKNRMKPHLIVDLSKEADMKELLNWINKNNIKILNIAGPRESQSPGIYHSSSMFLEKALSNILTNGINSKTSLDNPETNADHEFKAKL